MQPHSSRFLARERIQLLLDEDSPFLELCALAGYGQEDMTLGRIYSIFWSTYFTNMSDRRINCRRYWSCQVKSQRRQTEAKILTKRNSGVLCIVSATVPTLFGGAINEASVLKSGRIHQIAMQNRLPTITLTQSVCV